MSIKVNKVNSREANLERFWISQAGILKRDGKILILKMKKNNGLWDLPGGRLEKNENYKNGFVRELEEELNLKTVEIGPVVDYDIWYTEDRNIPVCVIACLIKTNDPIKLSEEHVDYRWIDSTELKDYDFFWPEAKRFIISGLNYKK